MSEFIQLSHSLSGGVSPSLIASPSPLRSSGSAEEEASDEESVTKDSEQAAGHPITSDIPNHKVGGAPNYKVGGAPSCIKYMGLQMFVKWVGFQS